MKQGKWLKDEVSRAGFTASGFARRVGVSRSQLQKWFTDAELKMRPDLMWAVLDALGYSWAVAAAGHVRGPNRQVHSIWDEYVEGTGVTMAFRKLRQMQLGGQLVRADAGAAATAVAEPSPPEIPVEVEDVSPDAPEFAEAPRPLYDIPTFDLSLAAGPWSDVIDAPWVCSRDSVNQGLFRVRLAGDSMSPTYKTGMIIEFECLRWAVDRVEVGRDYYVQREDGAATFKRVESVTEESITLRAINRRKYPDPIVVERERITKMAIARWEVRPLG